MPLRILNVCDDVAMTILIDRFSDKHTTIGWVRVSTKQYFTYF